MFQGAVTPSDGRRGHTATRLVAPEPFADGREARWTWVRFVGGDEDRSGL